MNLRNNFYKYFWLLMNKQKIINQLGMKRRTDQWAPKNMENGWLADFYFQENVSLFINYMNIAK